MENILVSKPGKLFLALSSFFVANAIIAETVGSKIFSLERSLGFAPITFSLFGVDNLSFELSCGVILWPVAFIMTDIVNEYFGVKAVKRISLITVILILYTFLCFYLSIQSAPTNWWMVSKSHKGVPDMQSSFSALYGQGMWIIIGSVIAFSVGQILDARIFHRIKKATGEKKMWLRATGSTLVSQLIDSLIVVIIAFKLGSNWTWVQVFAIALSGYMYKFLIAIVLTPLLYLLKGRIDHYLGDKLAKEMKQNAMHN